MSDDNTLSPKDIFSESLLRDLILFSIFYVLVIGQEWEEILLLLFPLILFGFSLFFRILQSVKHRIEFSNKPILFNPFGLEEKNANRLYFCAILLLVLIFWLGAESIYHPQLIDNIIFYFVLIYVFIYCFGFFWLFIDLWKYSRIELNINEVEPDNTSNIDSIKNLKNNLNKTPKNDSIQFKETENVISLLKIKIFKRISQMNLIIFLLINLFNAIFALFMHFELFTIIGFQYNLPGTGIEDSEPILLSFVIYGFLIASPAFTIYLLIIIYKNINDVSEERFNKALEKLEKKSQIRVIENLKTIMNK